MINTNKFTGKAIVYAKFRPNYPNEYINYLFSTNSLTTCSIIADIGSGTGILTQQLLDMSLGVMAVEPNNDMRTIAENLLSGYPKFISVDGTAENTTLQKNCIDLITVAQAFHWFDKDLFKAECSRILRPNAKVSLVWNSRDVTSELIQENEIICKKMCPAFHGFSGGMKETPDVYKQFFKNGKYELKNFRNDLKFDLEGFIGRNLSASYAPKNIDSNYNHFIDALSKLFDKYSENNIVAMPNITKSYLGCV